MKRYIGTVKGKRYTYMVEAWNAHEARQKVAKAYQLDTGSTKSINELLPTVSVRIVRDYWESLEW